MLSDMEDMPAEMQTPDNIIDCFLDRGGEGDRIIACLDDFDFVVVKKSLLDALEQAQKERDTNEETWRFVDTQRSKDLASLTAERDAAQQDAKDALALLGEMLELRNWAPHFRARIEAMLEKKA